MKKVTVFCGAATGAAPEIVNEIKQFAALLAANNCELIYGGSTVGLMGIVADSMLAHGGKTTGVLPQVLADREIAHPHLSELIIVPDFAERKRQLFQMADTIVLLPGGPGSLDEFFDIANQIHVGLTVKKLGILNACDFYDGLIQQMRVSTELGFMHPSMLAQLQIAPTAQGLVTALQHAEALKVLRTYN